MKDKKLLKQIENEMDTIEPKRDILKEVKKIHEINPEILKTKESKYKNSQQPAVYSAAKNTRKKFGLISALATGMAAVLVLAIGLPIWLSTNNSKSEAEIQRLKNINETLEQDKDKLNGTIDNLSKTIDELSKAQERLKFI